MKKIIIALLLTLVVATSLVWANRVINHGKPTNEAIGRKLTESESRAILKNWEASPDGIKFKNWENSPIGKKVETGAIKINKLIHKDLSMVAEVTSLSLPEGSRLGYGFMVKIEGEDYILAFEGESNEVLKPLRKLKVNDKIVLKCHHVSKAPKYSFAILAPSYVEINNQNVYKRVAGKGGC